MDTMFRPSWECLCGRWFIRLPFYMHVANWSNSVRLIEYL
jgi:hypothetical protein